MVQSSGKRPCISLIACMGNLTNAQNWLNFISLSMLRFVWHRVLHAGYAWSLFECKPYKALKSFFCLTMKLIQHNGARPSSFSATPRTNFVIYLIYRNRFLFILSCHNGRGDGAACVKTCSKMPGREKSMFKCRGHDFQMQRTSEVDLSLRNRSAQLLLSLATRDFNGGHALLPHERTVGLGGPRNESVLRIFTSTIVHSFNLCRHQQQFIIIKSDYNSASNIIALVERRLQFSLFHLDYLRLLLSLV